MIKPKMKTLQHIATPGDFVGVKQHCPAYRACFTLTAVYTFPFGFVLSFKFQYVDHFLEFKKCKTHNLIPRTRFSV